jgi:hypothetical protein
MLWMVSALLLVLWLWGMMTGPVGAWFHMLLVIALVCVCVSLMRHDTADTF